MKLSKTYEPNQYEDDIYQLWEKSQAFVAQPNREAEHFSISMPPPNATGTLHVGHTLGIALQDIIARYARMQGKDVLLLPGTDHAALATNAIMEKRLTDEGTNKHEVGREEFVRRLREFIANSQDTMRKQIRAVGASCDWTREHYTLEDSLNRCVNETFVKMYKDDLIYRGHRIVNWDPKLETTVADDEVVRVEEKAPFYTFKYGPFEIGTARPETKFGDKYVVMHPKDKRYAKYKHGDTFEADWINGKITGTVIKDEAVDPGFGTGVMTITPWHDHTDFEIAERHKLDKEQIIDFHGNLLPIAGEFAGMHISKARPLIAEKLDKKGLLVSVDENYVHNIAVNDRGKGIIEPQIKLQWFVDVNKPAVKWKGETVSLKHVMRAVIDDGDVEIVPERFNKTYFHWIDNLRDWCISRQIWWGHRIPVWYRNDTDEKQEVYVGLEPPVDDGKEGWNQWEQDPDTLDTWFSSALWTWSTLLDPKLAEDLSLDLETILKRSVDFQTYHPTSVMETGWDILFFWVARMILATTYMTGQVPFKTVYLHGLVRAEDGQKMSKSKPETMIDPLEVIPKYGTDALRLALIHGTSPGNDSRMSIAKIVGQRNFCNKIWNVARYVEDTLGDQHHLRKNPSPKTPADHWMLSKLQQYSKVITGHLDALRFSDAYEAVYHLLWDEFADWYIEASKEETNHSVLAFSLETILKLAQPFAPFVTETIWQTLAWESDSLLALAAWPSDLPKPEAKAVKEFDELQAIVIETRAIVRGLHGGDCMLQFHKDPLLSDHATLVAKLARVTVAEAKSKGTSDQSREVVQLLQTKRNVWVEASKGAVQKYADELIQQQNEQVVVIKQLKQRLANKAYVANAPEAVVQQTKDQLTEAERLLESINQQQKRFS